MTGFARLSILAGAALTILAPHAGFAGDAPTQYKLYVRGVAGLNKLQDMEYDINAGEIQNEHDKGYTFSGAVGVDFSDYSAELEVAHRRNDIDTQSLAGSRLSNNSGDTVSTAVMVNGYYTTPVDDGIAPYVGLGIGGANVQLEDHTGGGSVLVDDGTSVFAYQAMAGLNYGLTDHLSLFGEYRYFATQTVAITTTTSTTHEVAYENHNVLLGLKYSFK